MKSCVVVCVFLLCTVGIALGIQCYVCLTEDDGQDCESSDRTILAKFKTDCQPISGTAAVEYHTLNRCGKAIENGELTRSCYFVDHNVRDNACSYGNGATTCLCSHDFCNAALRQTHCQTVPGTLLITGVLGYFAAAALY